MTLRPGENGYLAINLDGRGSLFQVHRLVALAFIENPDGKPCVNHKDGNKANNHYGNLEWVTHVENMEHSIKIGLHKGVIGSSHPCSKLDEDDVRLIRKKISQGHSLASLSRVFKVRPVVLAGIRDGKRWKHCL